MAAEDPEEVEVEVEQVVEAPLDPEAVLRRREALAQIRKFGDPVLKAQALPVDRFDDELRTQATRMAALMDDAYGIGLAATQVGILNRVLVYRVEPDSPTNVLVNPSIEWSSDEREAMDEGCLSLPGVHVEVERPLHVRVRARDDRGGELLVEASGLEARVIQHEIDHLDGVLILDRIGRGQRKEAMRALREALDEQSGEQGRATAVA